jgi:hypothetical protein
VRHEHHWVIAIGGVDELHAHAHPVSGPPDTPFEQRAHAQFLGDLARVDILPLERERRRARAGSVGVRRSSTLNTSSTSGSCPGATAAVTDIPPIGRVQLTVIARAAERSSVRRRFLSESRLAGRSPS